MPKQQKFDVQWAVSLISEAEAEGLTLRLFGSVAYWYHSRDFRGCFEATRLAAIRDIDYVALFAQKSRVEEFLAQRGWTRDNEVASVPGARSSLFYFVDDGLVGARIDIRFDSLDFCHTLDVRERLTVEDVTLPLAELLLTKLQIAEMTSADLLDVVYLLLGHDIGEADYDVINVRVVVDRCCLNWGLYTSVMDGLSQVGRAAASHPALTPSNLALVSARLHALCCALACAPKPFTWRVRAVFGKQFRWREEVDPIGLAPGEPFEEAWQ